MSKIRVNWTLRPDTVEILKALCKEAGRKISVSEMVDYTVQTKCRDPIERKREEAKELQRRLMQLSDEINVLEEQRRENGSRP